MDIGERMTFELGFSALVVGRTYEEDPKLDLKTPWGLLNGVPLSVLTGEDGAQALATNVTALPARRSRPANGGGLGFLARRRRKAAPDAPVRLPDPASGRSTP